MGIGLYLPVFGGFGSKRSVYIEDEAVTPRPGWLRQPVTPEESYLFSFTVWRLWRETGGSFGDRYASRVTQVYSVPGIASRREGDVSGQVGHVRFSDVGWEARVGP